MIHSDTQPNQDGTLLQYFKLALIQDDIPLPDGKTPVEIISDYLRSFHEYVVEQIQKTKGFQQYQQDEYKYVCNSLFTCFIS